MARSTGGAPNDSTPARRSLRVPAMIRPAGMALAVLLASSAFAAASCEQAPTFPASPDSGVKDAAPKPDTQAPPDAALGPLEEAPPAEIPVAMRKDATSSPLVFDALRGGVWTANGNIGSVSYVDVDQGHQSLVQEIPGVGKDITSIALSPDFAWVAAVDRTGAQVALT